MFIFCERKQEICRIFRRLLPYPLRGFSDYSLVSIPSSGGSAFASASQDPSLDDKEATRKIRHVLCRSCNRTVHDVVKRLEQDQSCSEIQISLPLVEILLSSFRDDWKSVLGFFKWACSSSSYEHTPASYTKMVDLLGKMKQFSLMLDLIDEMHTKGFITLDTLAKAMRRFTGAGMKEKAIKIFNEMELYGIKKNTEAMNILLDTLSKEGYVETAREIFLELKSTFPPDAYTFNIFVHGWCKINRMDEAKWTILEMKGYGIHPSVITYSTMIEAHCKNSSIDRVYDLLDMMKDEGCTPNVVTYTVIMHSIAKYHGFDAALHVVDRMNDAGCKPDRIFFNSLIFVLGRAGQLKEAIRVYERDMNLNGVTRDLSTYNTMISILCHNSLLEEAFMILDKMEESSCIPDLLTFGPILKLCLKREKIEDALYSLMKKMVEKYHLSFDLDTFSLLIHGLCKVGRIDRAFLLFEEMVNQEIIPRKQTWKLLLKKAEEKNMYSTIERINYLVEQCRNFAHA